MKVSILVASVAFIYLGGVSSAEEYYVVYGSNHHCEILTIGPNAASQADPHELGEVVRQPGPLAWPLPFKSRVDAKDHIKQSKDCGDGSAVGADGSTVSSK